MALPVTVTVMTLEIKNVALSDVTPTPVEGYEVVMLKDLGYTKLWVVFKVVIGT